MYQLEGDLVFDRIHRKLRCPALGKSWNAYSGKSSVTQRPKSDLLEEVLTIRPPHGWGRKNVDPLPKGIYWTGTLQLNAARDPIRNRSGYRDKEKFYWFLHILRWRGGNKGVEEKRSEFGIHPDGEPRGTTQGCIGLMDPDTEPIFNDIKKLIEQRGGKIWVEVL